MKNQELKAQAIQLREQGLAIKKIAAQLGIAKSTTSLWVRGVLLTEEQKQKSLEKISSTLVVQLY